jgi:hypothetical protein
MLTTTDILQIIGVIAATVAMIFVIRWRRRSHQVFIEQFADEEICEHLRPALQLLKERGHRIVRAGQRDPQLPLEVHMFPAFDPRALLDELKLEAPVAVSDRNVLYCQEDACEIHPLA